MTRSYRPRERKLPRPPAPHAAQSDTPALHREALAFVREAREHLALLKKALQLEPESANGQVAEELLYTIVFQKLTDLQRQDPLTLLRLAREQQRAADGKETRRSRQPAANPVEQGRRIRRRWRQLYGLEGSQETGAEQAADEHDQPE